MTETTASASALEAQIRAGVEAFNRRDYELALTYFHPEVEIDSSAAVVPKGPYRGIDGVRAFYRSIEASFAEFRIEPVEITIRGDHVLVAAQAHMRAHGSQENAVAEEFDLWTLRDGLAIRLEIIFDREEAEAVFAELTGRS